MRKGLWLAILFVFAAGVSTAATIINSYTIGPKEVLNVSFHLAKFGTNLGSHISFGAVSALPLWSVEA